jgi:hypothetical protein
MEPQNRSAGAPDVRQVAADILPQDIQELWRLDYGLRTNVPIGHDREALKRLIAAGVAMSSGMAVRITPLGREVLALRPAPR